MTHIPPAKMSTRIGWLFLFAVLMAAGLLFTMVFFVRVLIFGFRDVADVVVFLSITDHHVLRLGMRLHQSYRFV
jgi:hypothetical protein